MIHSRYYITALITAIGSTILTGIFANIFFEKKIEQSFEKGVVVGKKQCEMNGIDSITIDGKFFNQFDTTKPKK